MAVFGYARCSTDQTKQDVDRQIRELFARGAEVIFSEYVSGFGEKKPEQKRLFEQFGNGDTLMVTEVSRLSRSLHQLCHMDEIARSEKAIIKAGALTLDYSTGKADPMHRAMFQMMGIFAELERGVTVERIVSGIQNAKDKGKRMGRPPLTAENVPDAVLKLIPRYQKGGISVTEFAKKAGVSRQWLYRYFEVLGVEREVKGKTADSLPPKIKKLYRLWCDGKITVAEFSRRAGVGRKTVYRYIKLLKGE